MLSNYQTYRDHFLARFPNISQSMLTQNRKFILKQTIHALDQFNFLIETITTSLESILTKNIIDIIKIQLDSIKILPQVTIVNPTINLPPTQYYCRQTIANYLGP